MKSSSLLTLLARRPPPPRHARRDRAHLLVLALALSVIVPLSSATTAAADYHVREGASDYAVDGNEDVYGGGSGSLLKQQRNDEDGNFVGRRDERIRFADDECRILALFRFSGGVVDAANGEDANYADGTGVQSRRRGGMDAYSFMAAAQLAADHFNSRTPTVVPQLLNLAAEIAEECTIRIHEIRYRDGQGDAVASLSEYREIIENDGDDDDGSGGGGGGGGRDHYCSLIGADDERTIQVLSGAAELDGIPFVVNAPITSRINFPSVISPRYPVRFVARAMADYLTVWMVPPRGFVITLYDNEEFDGPFQERAEDELDYKVSGEWLVGEEDAIEDAIGEIVEEGYNTVLIDTKDPSLLPRVAEVANGEGLFDRPIFWLIGSNALSPDVLGGMENEIGSPMDRLLTGAALYADYDPFKFRRRTRTGAAHSRRPGNQVISDKFLSSWREQNASFVEKLNRLHPLPTDHPDYFAAGGPDYFRTTEPAIHSSFVYDAVMLTGISACRIQAARRRLEGRGNSTEGGHNSAAEEGMPLLNEMVRSRFDGASGSVRFGRGGSGRDRDENDDKEEEQSRDDDDEQEEGEATGTGDKIRSEDGFLLGVYNIRAEPVDDEGEKHRYYTVLTALYKNSAWRTVNSDDPFIYFDGTTDCPLPIRVTFETNYLDRGTFVAGIVLVSVALAVICGSCLWVLRNRHLRLVTASQPPFLYLLCLGSASVAISLVFVSFDEGMGYSKEELSRFCMIHPWLFVVGYVVIYCAIVGKLWRINKLVSNPLRRQRVGMLRALWPFAFLMGCVVVLTCWQVIDPFVWVRVIITNDPLETLGRCESNNATPYIASLGALIGIMTFLTLRISWKTRRVQEELSESRWIFAGVFSHLQLWAVGIPVYIILSGESGSSAYIIKVVLAFLFSTVMVVLVIWPKIYTQHFADWAGRDGQPTVRVNVFSSKAKVSYNDRRVGDTIKNSGLSSDGPRHQHQSSEQSNTIQPVRLQSV